MKGDLVEWVLLLGSLLVGALALTVGRDTDTLSLETSIVREDATGLGCFGGVEAATCGFNERGALIASSQPSLHPFVTTQGELVVAVGVFESPKVAAWLAAAGDERVRVRCAARLLSALGPFGFRFRASDSFAQRDLAAFSATDCEVLP